jgi:hypothetical protein
MLEPLFSPVACSDAPHSVKRCEAKPTPAIPGGTRADFARLRVIAMRARGITLELRDGKPVARPAKLITPKDMEAIASDRALFIRLIELGPCSGCGKQLHANGACYHCCNRPCEVPGCGRMTGSAFIRMCLYCGAADDKHAASGERELPV